MPVISCANSRGRTDRKCTVICCACVLSQTTSGCCHPIISPITCEIPLYTVLPCPCCPPLGLLFVRSSRSPLPFFCGRATRRPNGCLRRRCKSYGTVRRVCARVGIMMVYAVAATRVCLLRCEIKLTRWTVVTAIIYGHYIYTTRRDNRIIIMIRQPEGHDQGSELYLLEKKNQ